MSEPTPVPVPVPEDMKPFVNYHVVSGPRGKGLVLGQREGDPTTLWLVPIENPLRGFGLSLEAVKTLAGDLRSFLESWRGSVIGQITPPPFRGATRSSRCTSPPWVSLRLSLTITGAIDEDDIEERVSHV